MSDLQGKTWDTKELQKDLDIGSFQRVYKILKVLKDLDLVQTYGRPMKSILNSPVKTWQKIKPKQLYPIHTESPQFFIKAASTSTVRAILPKKEKVYKCK